MTGRASVEGDERLRLFLALRLPDGAVERLLAWQHEALAAADARPVPRANLHVTLAFLHSRPASALPRIVEELRAAAAAAGPVVLEARDYRETPRVGMLRLADRDWRAHDLAQDVQGRLAALGLYTPERRRWLPHVTVLRFREPPRLRPPLPDLGEVVPSEAAAYLSRLHPSGARYEVLESVPLGG